MGQLWEFSVPYEKRQVWGAWAVVPVETCRNCPFYKKFGYLNRFKQEGVCYYGRHEAKDHNMGGKALCT